MEARGGAPRSVVAVVGDDVVARGAAAPLAGDRVDAGGERASAHILASAWPRLEAALLASWHDPGGRQTWVLGVLAQARHLLPRGVWTLRHAPDWPETEWQALGTALTAELGSEPRFVADGSVSAGLAIEGAGALLDGTLEGLLKDRTRIEARLLALLEEIPPA